MKRNYTDEQIEEAFDILQEVAECENYPRAEKFIHEIEKYFSAPSDEEIHNPENIPAEKLPEGMRFFCKKEAEYFQKLDKVQTKHEYKENIHSFSSDGNEFYENSRWFGSDPNMTYVVPIEFRIEELGEY